MTDKNVDDGGPVCKNCGGTLIGDGYTMTVHCENIDIIGEGYEADAGPIYCEETWT